MHEPILIALHGARGAGKDTTFHHIERWCAKSDPALSAVRRGFADKMKWAYMRQWVPDCTMQWAIDFIDQWKYDPSATCIGVHNELTDDMASMSTQVFIPGVNFRDHMNQFATESAREVYGDDHWVDQVLPLEPTDRNPEGWRGNFLVPPRSAEEDPYSFAHFAVITDLRAENEYERIRAIPGSLLVKVRRREAEKAEQYHYQLQGKEPHLFARELPDDMFDVVLNNDSTLENGYLGVNLMMDEVKRNGVASIQRGLPRPWRI